MTFCSNWAENVKFAQLLLFDSETSFYNLIAKMQAGKKH